MHSFAALVCGWALDGPSVPRRRLVDAPEPCSSSCDEGHNAKCDAMDEDGVYTLSCDEHPTTSCDEDCVYSPPPPLAPWLENGTYPSPPPLPAPSEAVSPWPIIVGGMLLAIAFFAMLFLCCKAQTRMHGDGSRMARIARCFCCCGFFFKDAPEDDDVFDPDDTRPPTTSTIESKLRLQWDAAAFKMIAAKAAEQNQAAKMQIRAAAQRL